MSSQSAYAPISREVELLLCCARTELGAGVAERVRSLARENLAWEHLVALAVAHGVTPLLYRNLEAICGDAVPAATTERLARLCRHSAIQRLAMTAELLRILDALNAQGIPALAFKGPALAASAYGDVTLREFYDLDILASEGDLQRAKALIRAQGYLTREEAKGLLDCSPTKKHWYLEHARCGMGLDLHWRLTPAYFSSPADWNQLWGRQRAVIVFGLAVPSLSTEDTLLALCAHGATECWGRLLSVCDVAQCISAHRQLDWTFALERACETGNLRRLLLGLLLARDLLGAAIPQQALLLMSRHPQLPRLAAEAWGRMFSDGQPALGHVESCAAHLRMMERLRDKALYCLGLLHECVTPNSTDRAVVPLPEWLSILYFLIHPVRLAVTYGPRVLKYLLRSVS